MLKVLVSAIRLSVPGAVTNILGRAQPVIPPNLYVNEHNSLGSPGNDQHIEIICVTRSNSRHAAHVEWGSQRDSDTKYFMM